MEPQKEAEAVNASRSGRRRRRRAGGQPDHLAQTAQKRGIYMIGKDVDVHEFAPKAWLTGASWNWGPMMEKLVEEIRAGKLEAVPRPRQPPSGAAVFDPFGAAVPEAARKKDPGAKRSHRLRKEASSGRARSSGQDGKPARLAGEKPIATAVETMDYLVKGVIGSAKYDVDMCTSSGPRCGERRCPSRELPATEPTVEMGARAGTILAGRRATPWT